MKALTDAVKQMLNGLAHANAGDYISQREKLSVLNQSGQATSTPQTIEAVEENVVSSNRRHVGLYMGSGLPSEVMDYVIQTCRSLNNDLTVLTSESKKAANALLEPYKEALAEAGINMQVANFSGEPVPAMARYLRKHPEVAFLACKDSGYLGRGYVNGTQRKNALPVPVVVVATGKAAALSPQQTDTVSHSSVV